MHSVEPYHRFLAANYVLVGICKCGIFNQHFTELNFNICLVIPFKVSVFNLYYSCVLQLNRIALGTSGLVVQEADIIRNKYRAEREGTEDSLIKSN